MNNLEEKLNTICDYIYQVKHANDGDGVELNQLKLLCYYHKSNGNIDSIRLKFVLESRNVDYYVDLYEKTIQIDSNNPITTEQLELPAWLKGITELNNYKWFLTNIVNLKGKNVINHVVRLFNVDDYKLITISLYDMDSSLQKSILLHAMDLLKNSKKVKREKKAILQDIVSQPDFWKYAIKYI